jgi:transcriptional regulator with XRE-family HTH domain
MGTRGAVVSKAWPWVAAQMNARGWKQKALAEATGYTVPTVSRWLSGKQKPEEAAVVAVANAFRVEIDTVPAWSDVSNLAGTTQSLGRAPSASAIDAVASYPVTPTESDPETEGSDMPERRAYCFVQGLPAHLREAAVESLYAWFRDHTASPGTAVTPSHPPARGAVRRRRK